MTESGQNGLDFPLLGGDFHTFGHQSQPQSGPQSAKMWAYLGTENFTISRALSFESGNPKMVKF